jgi:hypothetical protein
VCAGRSLGCGEEAVKMRRFLREINLAKWSAPSMLIATSIYYSNSKNHFSQCNNNNAELRQPTPTVPANITTPPLENEEKNETKTEYELWLKEKEKCGLCRMFMASPCRKQVTLPSFIFELL